MKLLYNICFILLGIISLLLGFNLGIQSYKEPDSIILPIETKQQNTPSLTSNQSNILVVPAVPPITLDTETALHLKEFRYKARELQNQFPSTFFISGSDKDMNQNNKRIALTFDDGPDKKTTPAIIDILNKFKIKATFFVTGENANRYPDIVQAIYNAGHQIANHSWSHERPLSLDTDELLKEINDTNEILHNILDIPYDKFCYFRPPYGLLTSSQLQTLQINKYTAICWSIDSMDWYASSPEEIKKCVVDSIHPSAIVLMHSAGGKDGRTNTIKALPGIIIDLSKQGYEFVTIDELIEN